ncbi:proline-rich protein [Lyophyllum atratum]|nr:proline-rich protein [Lyophyllum atratum]
MAPSFAELKAKAGKAKDATMSKVRDTRDKNTSVPMAKTNWDPYSKQPAPPPPPPRVHSNTRPAPSFPPPPPAPNRPTLPPPPSRTPSIPSRTPTLPIRSPAFASPSSSPALTPTPAPRPPPRSLPSSTLPSSGPPPIIRSTRPDIAPRVSDEQQEPTIDWANLSDEDKEVFFSWLDEFFSKSLNITIPPRDSRAVHR